MCACSIERAGARGTESAPALRVRVRQLPLELASAVARRVARGAQLGVGGVPLEQFGAERTELRLPSGPQGPSWFVLFLLVLRKICSTP
jgi:hypothetical protein